MSDTAATELPTTTMLSAASIATHDVREDLMQVDVPAVVVVGTHDKLTPPIHARELNQLIRGSELRTLPGIGHQVMQEQHEAIEAAVDALVARRR